MTRTIRRKMQKAREAKRAEQEPGPIQFGIGIDSNTNRLIVQFNRAVNQLIMSKEDVVRFVKGLANSAQQLKDVDPEAVDKGVIVKPGAGEVQKFSKKRI